MNHQHSLPLPERAPKLDALIDAAERAVVERDLRVQGDIRGLRERLRTSVAKRAGIGLAVAAGGLVVGRMLWRRRRRPVGAVAATNPPPARHAASSALWAHLLPLAWPLLPVGVRSRMSPRTAAMVIGLALPMFARLSTAKPTTTVQSAPRVDLPLFAGHWFEIARLPPGAESRCVADVTATYALAADGLRIRHCCRLADGTIEAIDGAAHPVEGGNGAKLRISMAPPLLRGLPWAWHDWWILRVDEGYTSALIGTPDRRHLWFLSRAPTLGVARMQAHLDHARQQGYDTSRLLHTPQT